MSKYQILANDFLIRTGVTFEAKFLKNDFHFASDKTTRDIYEITLARGSRKMIFNFGQSLNSSGDWLIRVDKATKRVFKLPLENFINAEELHLSDTHCIAKLNRAQINLHGERRYFDRIERRSAPTAYAVLACLTKHSAGTIENFCSDFGYDIDSKSAEQIYLACEKEFEEVQKLWTDAEIEELREIN
jgi:hypothetical protein